MMKIKNVEEMNTDTGQKYYVLVCGEPDSLCEKRHMVRANSVVLKDRPLEFWEKAVGALCREYLAIKKRGAENVKDGLCINQNGTMVKVSKEDLNKAGWYYDPKGHALMFMARNLFGEGETNDKRPID